MRAEDLQWHECALEAARALGRRTDEAALLAQIGDIHSRAGELDAALSLFEQALALAREGNDRASEGAILHLIGLVQFRRGQTDEAERCLNDALAAREEVDDKVGLGDTLNALGELEARRGNAERAQDFFRRAAEVRAGERRPDRRRRYAQQSRRAVPRPRRPCQRGALLRVGVGHLSGCRRRCATDALALAQQIGDHNGESIASRTLSVMDLDAWARSVTPPRKSLVDRLQFWKT